MGLIKNNSTILKEFSKQNWEYLTQNINFTDDELMIINFIKKGWKQIDIAEELSVCEMTIKRKYKKILNKIDVFFVFISFF